MSNPALENFRRSEVERWVEQAIKLLDETDGDHDFEDDEIEDIRVYAPARRLLAGEFDR
jgi:hypothetical protein